MKKEMIICITIMAMFLISGCAVSDYLSGKDVDTKTTTLQTEDESTSEIDEILKELESDSDDSEEISSEIEELTINEDDTEESTTEAASTEEVEKVEPVKVVKSESTSSATIIRVKEGELVRLKPVARDDDQDSIQYTFSSPLNENGEWQTNYGDSGEYDIAVTATDGKLATQKDVKLVVEKVNAAPIITNVGDISVFEGEIIKVEPKIVDPNGDKVSVEIGEPIGADGIWETDYDSAGEYMVDIIATDGAKTSKKTIEVVVNPKNVAPSITNVEDIQVEEGETLTINPTVTDLNGDEVTVEISAPVGNDGIWETDYTDNGVYEVTIKANDGQSITTKTIEITVGDVNRAPVIVDIIQQ